MLDKYFHCSSRSGGVSKDPTYCLMRVWLAMAELHLDRGDLQAADECAMEARTLTPHAYQVTVTRALIQEACGHTEAARHLFEDALAVNPFNSDNIAHLARIYFRQGHHRYDYERSFSQYILWRSIRKSQLPRRKRYSCFWICISVGSVRFIGITPLHSISYPSGRYALSLMKKV